MESTYWERDVYVETLWKKRKNDREEMKEGKKGKIKHPRPGQVWKC